jgi:hypothetical protein
MHAAKQFAEFFIADSETEDCILPKNGKPECVYMQGVSNIHWRLTMDIGGLEYADM